MLQRTLTRYFGLLAMACCLQAQAVDITPAESGTWILSGVSVTAPAPPGEARSLFEPVFSYYPDDIAALGLSNISELIEELEPHLAGLRGSDGERVYLVNGVRVASFREISSYPTEAIQRMDVLTAEAALQYGYGPGFRVLNVVLVPEFHAWTLRTEAGGPLQSGGFRTGTDVNRLTIQNGERLNLSGNLITQSGILESQRGLARPEEGADSLRNEEVGIDLTASTHRSILGDAWMTLSGDLVVRNTQERLGYAALSFDLPENSPFYEPEASSRVLRYVGVPDELMRVDDVTDANLNLTISKPFADWFITATARLSQRRNESERDRVPDAAAYQLALAILESGVSPTTDIAPFLIYSAQRSQCTTETASANVLANGDLFELPGGPVNTGFSLDVTQTGTRSETVNPTEQSSQALERRVVKLQGSLDLPLVVQDMELPGIDTLTANVTMNAGEYSDFGNTLGVNVSLNWVPNSEMRLLTSYSHEDGAPGVAQIGEDVTITENSEIMDYLTGERVEVTRIRGGNPALNADTREVLRVSGEWSPFEEADIDFRASYVSTHIDEPAGSFPVLNEAVQTAFSDRFARADTGVLQAFDSRPVNYLYDQRRDVDWQISWRNRTSDRGDAPSPRAYMTLRHVLHLEARRAIAEGVAIQDYLNGASTGLGGKPDQEVHLTAGLTYGETGARLRVGWKSDTFVDTGRTGSHLYFSDVTTSNLRLFHSIGSQDGLAPPFAWLDGAQVTLEVDNIFDDVVQVSDGNSVLPTGHEPDRLDPNGRVVMVALRRQF